MVQRIPVKPLSLLIGLKLKNFPKTFNDIAYFQFILIISFLRISLTIFFPMPWPPFRSVRYFILENWSAKFSQHRIINLPLKENNFRPERTQYVHKGCTGTDGKKRPKDADAVPARFLLACPDGHLDDFPWPARSVRPLWFDESSCDARSKTLK